MNSGKWANDEKTGGKEGEERKKAEMGADTF